MSHCKNQEITFSSSILSVFCYLVALRKQFRYSIFEAPYISALGLNTERYEVSPRYEYGHFSGNVALAEYWEAET